MRGTKLISGFVLVAAALVLIPAGASARHCQTPDVSKCVSGASFTGSVTAYSANLQGRRTTVTAGTLPDCTDCSLAERERPRAMRFAPRRVGILSIWKISWIHWGSRKAYGLGPARVETNGYDYGWAEIYLTRIRRHVPDGCGNRGQGKMYTRATIRLHNIGTHSKVIRLALPRTGCETS